MTQEKTALELKEAGNAAYKSGDLDTALAHYTEGLSISKDEKEQSVLYKNRAAVNLKIEKYDDVISDCDKALELVPRDPKSLFRRAQAYDAQGNVEKAYADARAVQELDPKNKDTQEMLTRLHRLVQDRLAENTRLSGKVKQMLELVFDLSVGASAEKRVTGANNLVALAKERAGSELLISEGIMGRIVSLFKIEKSCEIRVACIRTLSQLTCRQEWCVLMLKEVGLPWLIDALNSTEEDQVNSAEYLIQALVTTISELKEQEERQKKAREAKKSCRPVPKVHQKAIDSILVMVTVSLTNRAMSALCRDSLLKILIRFVPYEALNWCASFVRAQGVEKLLEIASEVDEFKDECSISITENSRLTTAILLGKVYDNMADDKERGRITDIIEEYMRAVLMRNAPGAQVRVAVMLTTLLLGPLDLGGIILGKEGVLSMLLAMANSEDVMEQKVACEALIAAANKKDKCRSIMTEGTDILKRLYASKDNSIKVRALVGLCKLGSLGGTDATMRPFADGASGKLAEACRRFLVNPTKDKDMRRWACEGLSYLTLDAEIKERLIDDRPALRSMMDLAQSGDLNCVYGVVTTFVNLCNAYDKQEIMPEMIELAKFAKQHIPEEHELDDRDFVDKRINILAEEGAGAALVALSKTESDNCRELIGRLMLSLCEGPNHRGLMVQQGASKALLALTQQGTDKGKQVCAHALARIAVSINPDVAFPGQRAYETVRPLLSLLVVDAPAIATFEALLGLCNLAGAGEGHRQRLLKEGGLAKVEHCMFEQHEMIRRAAIQCFANLCMSPDVVKLLGQKNDKLKYLLLCCADEDLEIVKAAAGGMCIALGASDKLAAKIFEAKAWLETLLFMLSHADVDVVHRGAVLVGLVVGSSKDTARTVINTHVKEALVAVCKLDGSNPGLVHPRAQEAAREAISQCVQMELISDPFRTDD